MKYEMGRIFLNLILMLYTFRIASGQDNTTTSSQHLTNPEGSESYLHHSNIDQHDTLKFPINHGEFFSLCLKTVYGAEQISTFTATKPFLVVNGQNKMSPLHGGLKIKIGEGRTKYSKKMINREISVDLEILDFIMFNSDEKEPLDFQIDLEPRNGTAKEMGILKIKNPGTCMKRFNKRFSKQSKQAEYNEMFTTDPKAFCKLHLELFPPAEVEYNLNLKFNSTGLSLMNKEPFKWQVRNATEYPHKMQEAIIEKNVEFVESKAPTGEPKVLIVQLSAIISNLDTPAGTVNLTRKFIEDNLPKVPSSR